SGSVHAVHDGSDGGRAVHRSPPRASAMAGPPERHVIASSTIAAASALAISVSALADAALTSGPVFRAATEAARARAASKPPMAARDSAATSWAYGVGPVRSCSASQASSVVTREVAGTVAR